MMANQLYDKAFEAFLTGQLNWLTDDIRVCLVDLASYTPDLAADQFLDSVPPAAQVHVSGSLVGKTATAGVADADDVILTAVTGNESEALVIYRHVTVDADSPLIAFIDTAGGLPITPSGLNLLIQWDSGANKIFKL